MAFTKVLGPGIHTLANFHSHNINSSGIITATKFIGDMTVGSGSTGTFSSLTITGNLGVGGTVTYMDVTNVDAVGIITAQEGIHFGIGATAGKFLASTGITTFSSSVGIADSIFHVGNTDTSIRFPSDDTFTIETAGSEALRIDSSGNIKLTSSNYQTLAIKQFGYGSSYQSIMVGNPNSNVGVVALNVDVSGISGSNFHAKDQVITGYRGFLTPNVAGNNFIGVFTRDASVDKIYFGPSISSGLTNGPITATTSKVGINDDTPDATLSVGGATAFIDVGAAGGNRGKIGYSSNDLYFGTSSSSGEFIFKNNVNSNDNPASSGTEKLRILSTGRIGIGTDTVPRDMVRIHNPAANASSYIQFTNENTGGMGINDGTLIGISQNNSNTDGTGSGFTILNKENAEITLGTNNLERLRIGPTGVSTFTNDVRIVKTGGPLLELTTNTGAADATLRLSEGATGTTSNGGGMVYSGANNKLHITCGTDSTTQRITINRDGGNVSIASSLTVTGITTAANYKLSAVNVHDGTLDSVYEGQGSGEQAFIYDTRLDSDGGAWRKRCQNTSWYNETFDSRRGSKKEFPSVVAITMDQGEVNLYDCDDPDTPLWMTFDVGYGHAIGNNSDWPTAVTCLNGIMVVGCYATYGGMTIVNFVKDEMARIRGAITSNGTNGWWPSGIAGRNANYTAGAGFDDKNIGSIVSDDVWSVAMTAPPDAPIDPVSKLPIPYIAAGCDSGISIITPDWHDHDWVTPPNGAIYNIISSNGSYTIGRSVEFTDNHDLAFIMGDGSGDYDYLYVMHPEFAFRPVTMNITITTKNDSAGVNVVRSLFRGNYNDASVGPFDGWFSQGSNTSNTDNTHQHKCLMFKPKKGYEFAAQTRNGLTHILEDPITSANSMVAYATTSYCSGWMPGVPTSMHIAETSATTIVGPSNVLGSFGNFDSASGWALSGTGAFSISGGKLVGDGTAGDSFAQRTESPAALVEGREYLVTFYVDHTAGSLYLRVGNQSYSDNINSDGYKEVISQCSNVPTETLLFYSNAFEGNIDQVTVTEYNMVKNGRFNGNINFWTDIATSHTTESYNSGKMQIIGSGGTGRMTQEVTGLTVGRTYVFSYQCVSNGSGTNFCHLGTSSGGVEYKANLGISMEGYHHWHFEATSTSLWIQLGATNGSTANFDNVLLSPGAPDRSPLGRGMNMRGAVTRSPVATGADLLSYKGFAWDKFLEQPPNPALSFGTGNGAFMWWMNPNTAPSGAMIFSWSNRNFQSSASDATYIQCYFNGDDIRFDYTVNGQNSYSNQYSGGPNRQNLSGWTFVCGIRRRDTFEIWVNGQREVRSAVHANMRGANYTATDATLRIGCNPKTGSPDSGLEMALFRGVQYAPSETQIRKIFEDERRLFVENAKCTLSTHTDDHIEALAYDKVRDILHVGTDASRDEFSGLNRINSTSAAVTTVISASDGLIIEE